MVEAAASGRRTGIRRGLIRMRGVERELEIGRVLRGGWRSISYAGCLGDRDRLGRGRVEVADGDRDLEAERERVFEPVVGGDHQRAERDGECRARGGGLSACDHDHDLFRHAFLRWHYPDQVLRVGGALAALSARLARAPRYVRTIVAPLRVSGPAGARWQA